MNTIPEFWTQEEIDLIAVADSFERAAEIAVTVLERMKKDGRPIVEVCGSISTGGLGTIEKNIERFEKAVNSAKEHGLLVFDQIPFETAIFRLRAVSEIDGYCTDILDIFYNRIFMTGMIDQCLFLPDWESSGGARWEYEKAKELGITIVDLPEEWLL
jgi:hypothetical protein